MKISKSVLDIINSSVSGIPHETGGIMGSRNGRIITEVVMDSGENESGRVCVYVPDVDWFNNHINQWIEQGIKFMGIFHTHFANVKTLSRGDLEYIKRIMECMPAEVKILYFPVFVLPEREMVCYRAERNGVKTQVLYENVDIV